MYWHQGAAIPNGSRYPYFFPSEQGTYPKLEISRQSELAEHVR